jgi:hypothetical protein
MGYEDYFHARRDSADKARKERAMAIAQKHYLARSSTGLHPDALAPKIEKLLYCDFKEYQVEALLNIFL